jgi:hypothetical protein
MEKANASLLKGLGVGTLAGVCFGLGEFFLSEIPSTQGMGIVMFWLTPMLAGFAIALVTPKPNTVLASMLLSALVSLVILVAIGREGPLCAVLAFPLLATGIALGVVCGNLFRKYVMVGVRNQSMTMMLFFLAAPAFILAGHRAEYRELDIPRNEIITSSVTIAASPDEIWPHTFDRQHRRTEAFSYVYRPSHPRALPVSGIRSWREADLLLRERID